MHGGVTGTAGDRLPMSIIHIAGICFSRGAVDIQRIGSVACEDALSAWLFIGGITGSSK